MDKIQFLKNIVQLENIKHKQRNSVSKLNNKHKQIRKVHNIETNAGDNKIKFLQITTTHEKLRKNKLFTESLPDRNKIKNLSNKEKYSPSDYFRNQNKNNSSDMGLIRKINFFSQDCDRDELFNDLEKHQLNIQRKLNQNVSTLLKIKVEKYKTIAEKEKENNGLDISNAELVFKEESKVDEKTEKIVKNETIDFKIELKESKSKKVLKQKTKRTVSRKESINKYNEEDDEDDDEDDDYDYNYDYSCVNDENCLKSTKTNSKFNFFIYHESRFRIIWDFTAFILILVSLTLIPINLSFNGFQFIEKIEIFTEFFFLAEIILNFFTWIENEEDEKFNSKLIQVMENYLFKWFLIDLLCSIPFQFLINVCKFKFEFHIQNLVFDEKLLIWLVLIRCNKLYNTELSGRTLSWIFQNNNYNRIWISLIVFFYIIHISSCFFIFLGNSAVNSFNWISGEIGQANNKIEEYVISFYFNIVTVFTVGYGDFCPINLIEKIYISIFLVVGNLTYSYGISTISSVFLDRNKKIEELERKSDLLLDIKNEYNVPENLFIKIKNLIHSEYKKNFSEIYFFLENFPSNLRKELTIIMYKNHLKTHKFFESRNNDFMYYVLPMLIPQTVLKKDLLFTHEDILEEMYLVIKGSLSLQIELGNERIEVSVINENQQFGDILLYIDERSPFDLMGKSKFSEIFLLRKKEFMHVKFSYPSIMMGMLENSCKQYEYLEKRKELMIKLYNCYYSANRVKNALAELNYSLINKGFKEYFENDKDFPDENDFLSNHNKEIIKNSQNSIHQVETLNVRKTTEFMSRKSSNVLENMIRAKSVNLKTEIIAGDTFKRNMSHQINQNESEFVNNENDLDDKIESKSNYQKNIIESPYSSIEKKDFREPKLSRKKTKKHEFLMSNVNKAIEENIFNKKEEVLHERLQKIIKSNKKESYGSIFENSEIMSFHPRRNNMEKSKLLNSKKSYFRMFNSFDGLKIDSFDFCLTKNKKSKKQNNQVFSKESSFSLNFEKEKIDSSLGKNIKDLKTNLAKDIIEKVGKTVIDYAAVILKKNFVKEIEFEMSESLFNITKYLDKIKQIQFDNEFQKFLVNIIENEPISTEETINKLESFVIVEKENYELNDKRFIDLSNDEDFINCKINDLISSLSKKIK